MKKLCPKCGISPDDFVLTPIVLVGVEELQITTDLVRYVMAESQDKDACIYCQAIDLAYQMEYLGKN